MKGTHWSNWISAELNSFIWKIKENGHENTVRILVETHMFKLPNKSIMGISPLLQSTDKFKGKKKWFLNQQLTIEADILRQREQREHTCRVL